MKAKVRLSRGIVTAEVLEKRVHSFLVRLPDDNIIVRKMWQIKERNIMNELNPHKFHLDIPRIGYIILFRKKERDFVGNQIKKVQLKRGFKEEDAEYVHSAISCGGQWIMDVNPPRSKVIDMRRKYEGRYIKILRYTNEHYGRKGRYKVALWSVSQSNLRYDFFGALALKFKIFWQWKSRPFCTENILWAMKKEYPRFTALLPEEGLPAHFLVFNWVEQIWEGNIK